MKDHQGRKPFSFREAYFILVHGMRTAPLLSRARRHKLIDREWNERIMFAVTEVNGCPVCSYAHAKMALNAGMSDEEIRKMLSGNFADAPEEQMTAIMFAQHYADSRANPDQKAWEQLEKHYGPEKAAGILGAVRIIMMGNVMGIPWGGFIGRFRGKRDGRTTFGYEVGMLLWFVLIFPVAVIHALVSAVCRRPLIP
ncbi:MAG: carboxymuconolactone decarboxylase family protein [Clostridiales bacterium]|nr:carboxymuconolactone decarboxylase family protein [Clostridiales bacterium]